MVGSVAWRQRLITWKEGFITQYQRWLPHGLIMLWLLVPVLSGFFNGDQQSLIAHDEALYANRARDMLLQHNWIHPWETPHHKTPGGYWVIAVMFRAFGVTEVTARLPSVFASVLCALLLYAIARHCFNGRVAVWSVLVLSTSFIWVQYSRFATPDMVFMAIMLGSLLCLLQAETAVRSRPWLHFAAGVLVSLAFLVRSFLVLLPIAAVLPYLIVAHRRHRHLQNPWLYGGILLGLTPTFFWLWACWYWNDIAIIASLTDFLLLKTAEESHFLSDVLFYPASVAMNSWPWWIFALVGWGWLYRTPHTDQQRWLFGAAPVVALVLLTAASNKYHHYALALYPLLATLAGVGIEAICRMRSRWSARLLQGLALGLGALGALGVLLVVAISGFTSPQSSLHEATQPYLAAVLIMGGLWLVALFTWLRLRQRSAWFASLLLANWLTLAIAGGTGLIGNANPDLKAFVQEPAMHAILSRHTIAFTPLQGKLSVLMQFYTPHPGANLDTVQAIPSQQYAWVWEDNLDRLTAPHTILGHFQSVYLVQMD